MQPSDMPDSDQDSIDRRQLLQALSAGGAIAIAGCSGDGGSDGGDGGGGNGSSGGGGGQQTIQFLTMGVGDNIKNFFQENNTKFEEEHDVNVEFTSVTWDNAKTTVNNRVDGNKAPDVARWPARWIPQLVGKDALVSLDDLMQGEFLDKFPEGVANGTRYQDHYYGVPWAASNKCLYYNKDIFEQAGLDPENPSLNSWQEMLAAAKQIKNSDNVSKPALGLAGADAIETGSQYYHYHWSYGADLVSDQGDNATSMKPVVNTPEAVDALSFYTDLANEHQVTQSSPLSSTRQDIRQLFEAGELGMVIGHVYTGLNIESAKENGEADFDYGIVQVPKGPAARYSLYTIDTLAVFSQSEVQDLAYDFIDFYYDEERRFQYSKQKGFLPVTKDVLERDYFTESKNWAPFVKASEYARARPKLKQFNQFNSRMVQAIQEALAEQKQPKQALDDAQSDLKELMSN
ncbi:sugar ABC transporter substrate-binding protein [Halomicroarcula sp. F27]|uniref:Sugar ABC transporter substrate-binding protein n=2 Tax=Haloarcula nitratireducens TaxID=2487749 RepID=A0AAW4PIC4_9EURY|nr:sugar ABC transporter substrate-binding protein [Halomicroarcula nitratireducens]MBX0297502.1 sugar ABC transporter substrate-binding protein [Halomicroarcula nitratireducens]